MKTKVIKPQPKQLEFLNSEADITLYGGSAGGGKTSALLMKPLQYTHIKGFNAIIFRKSYTDITNPGALLDISKEFYSSIGHLTGYDKWKIENGTIKFHYLQLDKDLDSHQGAQYVMIGLDELTHFPEKHFFYLLSRNRGTCGVKPFVVATCNPDAESWVAKLVEWYIDSDGFAIPERSGIIRHFRKDDDKYIWSDEPFENSLSFTFIQSALDDNAILNDKDPDYKKRLEQLNRVDRERLLRGNWKIKKESGELFKREWFDVVDEVPEGESIRYWDLASTEVGKNKNPDYSVGIKLLKAGKMYYVTDMVRFRKSPLQTTETVKNTIIDDDCISYIELEGGSAARRDMASFIRDMKEYTIRPDKPNKSKIVRAERLSVAFEYGKIKLLKAKWNNDFINEFIDFPNGLHDDIVDATSGAYNKITKQSKVYVL